MREPLTVLLRGVVGVTLAVLLFVGSAALPQTSAFGQSQAAAPNCLGTSRSCPNVVAVSYASTSETKVTTFLTKLWNANSSGDAHLGAYQLQRCGNPGPAPYRVTCVLWSSATKKDLHALKKAFTESRLFKTVAATFPKASERAVAD
jgi:hypothetical protein